MHGDPGLARDLFALPLKTRISSVSDAGGGCGRWPRTSAQCQQQAAAHGGILAERGAKVTGHAGAIVDAGMDVYLVPVGDDRYELYCEVPDEPDTDHETAAPGASSSGSGTASATMLAEAERERRQGTRGAILMRGWTARTKARMMRWVAESIAEQRLLWHLRSQTDGLPVLPRRLEAQPRRARLRAQLRATSRSTASG